MSLNTRVIVLDGVGINLKTTLMDRLEELNWIVVKSDSSYYQITNPVLFPRLDDITVKLQCRFMEVCEAVSLSKQKFARKGVGRVYVDRGFINQLVWARLLRDEVIDDYKRDLDTYDYVLSHVKDYLKLELSMNMRRLLLITERDDILDDALDESKYNTDPHTQFRIDTFYDKEYYKTVQAEYVKTYDEFTKGGHKTYTITNEGTIEDHIQGIFNELDDLVCL